MTNLTKKSREFFKWAAPEIILNAYFYHYSFSFLTTTFFLPKQRTEESNKTCAKIITHCLAVLTHLFYTNRKPKISFSHIR